MQAAADAFRGWRGTPATERARLLWTLADLIEARSEELAAIEVLDNGKPIGEARAVDIALTIEIFRYYAGWTTKIAGSVPPNSIRGMLTMIRREPVGVVAAITPWNFPLLEVAYKLGPALAAGCTVVVKPSELAPLSTLRLMDLVEEAGLPPGVVNAIIGGPEIGAALVRHPGVREGGVHRPDRDRDRDRPAGRAATSSGSPWNSAARAPTSSSPTPTWTPRSAGRSAASSSTRARPAWPGRGCSSRRRSSSEVTERLVAKAAEVRLGHGLDPATDMGPLISANHRRRVLGHVAAAREDGAQVAVGGAEARPEGLEQGFFIEPTVVRGRAATACGSPRRRSSARCCR